MIAESPLFTLISACKFKSIVSEQARLGGKKPHTSVYHSQERPLKDAA